MAYTCVNERWRWGTPFIQGQIHCSTQPSRIWATTSSHSGDPLTFTENLDWLRVSKKRVCRCFFDVSKQWNSNEHSIRLEWYKSWFKWSNWYFPQLIDELNSNNSIDNSCHMRPSPPEEFQGWKSCRPAPPDPIAQDKFGTTDALSQRIGCCSMLLSTFTVLFLLLQDVFWCVLMISLPSQ